MSQPQLWGLKRVTSQRYPVVGDTGTHPVAPVYFDVKEFLQRETVSQLWLRVVGSVSVTGVGTPGAATGRENPEAFIVSIQGTTKPSFGGISKNQLSARGCIAQRIFDNGYSFRATAISDGDTAVIPVDFLISLRYQMPGSVNPIEWALPMAAFSEYSFRVSCGGRDQLYSAGDQTWDLAGLQFELWADYNEGVAGQFHYTEEFEQSFPITASQSDFQIRLDSGWMYSHLLFLTERDNVLVNDILNNVNIQSGGRVWLPQGDANAEVIQRWNRDTHVNNAAEVLTGLYFIPALRDGMYTRAIDALTDKLEVRLDVTRTSGVELVTVRGRRIKPLALTIA